MSDLPDYVQKARENWGRWPPDCVAMGERARSQRPDWGIWGRHHELQNPNPGDEVRFFVDANWAHDFPSEQVWHLRKT